jgi:hypothetical protein
MAELLDRIHAEIRARLEANRPAVDEYRMLEAALTAIDGVAGPPRASDAESSALPAKRRAPRRSSRPAAKRAPRGANRAAVLRVLGERPGVGAGELSVVSGVARPVLYQLLGKLVEQGEVVKERRPGIGTGYRLRPEGIDSSGTSDGATAGTEPIAIP